ncbi:hypothetical protein CNMCM6106_008331 [Aspergillus hiratsukae]|uniref:AB hydrolase-1 domain-containing protein n=1 Tax=Aspergillus hiratsukae TaxID=1194566 RepID=A0A8H6QKJ9_9EURO|nr:hypothetical protein CNMCM6106_008331 [Aspergillus hiratsukae]
MGTTNPAVVIVPGGYSLPLLFTDVAAELSKKGYPTTVIKLPSVGTPESLTPQPPPSMEDDAVHTQGVVAELADEGFDVMVLSHSYGGMCATEGVKGLAKPIREAQGKKGGVVRLVYLSSLAPVLGMSAMDTLSKYEPDPEKIKDGYSIFDIAYGDWMFTGLPESERGYWAQKFTSHSVNCWFGKLTYAGYKDIPVSYLICEEDAILPVDIQQRYVDTLKEQTGKEVDVHRLKADHFPSISQPKLLVDIIQKLWETAE